MTKPRANRKQWWWKVGKIGVKIRETASWLGAGRTIAGVVIGVLSAAFLAGGYYKEAAYEVDRFKSRVATLETKFASLSSQQDQIVTGTIQRSENASRQDQRLNEITKRQEQLFTDIDQQLERLSSERRTITSRSVDAPIVGSSADARCASGEYVVGLQIAGIGSGALGSSGRITYQCANFPRLKLPRR